MSTSASEKKSWLHHFSPFLIFKLLFLLFFLEESVFSHTRFVCEQTLVVLQLLLLMLLLLPFLLLSILTAATAVSAPVVVVASVDVAAPVVVASAVPNLGAWLF